MALLNELFSGENATPMALALGLLKPTPTGSFGEALSNAGMLALQAQKQSSEEKITAKLYDQKVEESKKKLEKAEKEKMAFSKIFEQYQNPENTLSLGDLFIQQAGENPTLAKQGIELKAQENKVKLETEKTQRAQALQERLVDLSSDNPMAQAMFAGGQIGPGATMMNQDTARQQSQIKQAEKEQENIDLAFTVLSQIQNEPDNDEFDETENFKKLVQQQVEALKINPQSSEIRRNLTQSQKELARLEDAKNKQKNKDLSEKDKTISSATKLELDEVQRAFDSQNEKFGPLTGVDIDTDMFGDPVLGQTSPVIDFSANRIKALTSNGLDKNTAMKHVTDFVRFSLLSGKKIDDLTKIPIPTAKDIKDLERTNPRVTDNFSEKQTQFFAKFGYLPGIIEFTGKTEVKTKSGVSAADAASYEKIRQSGNVELIGRAQEIFFKKYGHMP